MKKEKERFEAGLADAIKRDPSLANSYFVDPKGTLERFQKTQEKFRPLPEYDKQDLNLMGQLGIDRQNLALCKLSLSPLMRNYLHKFQKFQ